MLRATARLVPALAPRVDAVVGARSMGLGGLKGYDDKEAAEEMLFFKKEDERLMRKLLNKARAQAQAADPHAAAGAVEAEKSSLKAILGKYNVSDADLLAVINWKHSADH